MHHRACSLRHEQERALRTPPGRSKLRKAKPKPPTTPDDLPDARDGLTRKERVVLVELAKLQAERGERSVPLPMLYGYVLEHVDMSVAELQEIVARLGARRP